MIKVVNQGTIYYDYYFEQQKLSKGRKELCSIITYSTASKTKGKVLHATDAVFTKEELVKRGILNADKTYKDQYGNFASELDRIFCKDDDIFFTEINL
jgi:hypothetical protein